MAPLPRRALAGCALLAALVAAARPARANDPIIGAPAPVAALHDRAGRAAAPAGGVLVVDFFATWCGPCHAAIAALSGIARREPARVRLVIVDVGEPPAVVDGFFASHPLPPGATVLLDPDGSAARAWGQHRFPTTFVVGDDGVIRHINRGYGPGYPARLARWVAAMLGAP